MAMDMLQTGVDQSVIALWLGYESVEKTQIYLEATLAMKEKALSKIKKIGHIWTPPLSQVFFRLFFSMRVIFWCLP